MTDDIRYTLRKWTHKDSRKVLVFVEANCCLDEKGKQTLVTGSFHNDGAIAEQYAERNFKRHLKLKHGMTEFRKTVQVR